MMKLLRSFCVGLLSVTLAACDGMHFAEKDISARIIPLPHSVEFHDQYFTLTGTTTIAAGVSEASIAAYLQEYIQGATGIELKISQETTSGITLRIAPELESRLGDEGYLLSIGGEGISIEAASDAGLFYGTQSLRQLLPTDYEHQSGNAPIGVTLAGVNIVDRPRFTWRGFMLDEARHFQGKEAVFRILDQMALLKMNRFHWHLTDYQGWRIEIKKYPRLTEIGAFRADTEIGEPMGWESGIFSGIPHGGFYTQEDIVEIVKYASARHIQIIPEIEMPGHASAAIAAYPWLGTSKKTIEVPGTNGMHPDVFDVSNTRVIAFLHDVLDEVMTLFPSQVIHIGGDETMFDHWRTSADIQKLMKSKGLVSFTDLQVDFTNGISQYLRNHNRRMMGWNDILGANIHGWHHSDDEAVSQELDKGSVIHFWKGDSELISKAANDGYDIVNGIHNETYLDYPHHITSLRSAYHFNPVPSSLSDAAAKRIIGISAQTWTEFMPTPDIVESMVFPRLASFSEVGWTALEHRDYKSFTYRLVPLIERWDAHDIAYDPKHLKPSLWRELRAQGMTRILYWVM